jgi:hypothetical protein
MRAAGLFTAVGLASALGYALGLAAAIGLGAMITATLDRKSAVAAPAVARPGFDPSPFILNAFLVPALDADSVPLRFVDPRPAMGCERQAAVWMNRRRLKPGDLVPDAPFELEWLADGCRPFGAAGPRFEGAVKLTVYREDWGFSAMVEPYGLRAVTGGNAVAIRAGGASTPKCNRAGGACS